MKAIQYQKVGDYELVTKIHSPSLDPMATQRKAQKALESSPEWQGFLSLLQEARSLEGEPTQDLKNRVAQCHYDLNKRRAELCEENPIYFKIPNETNLPTEEADKLLNKLKALGPNEALLLDGSTIPDYRGTVVWTKDDKWSHEKITKLGVKPLNNQTLTKNLTPEQRQEIESQFSREALLKLTPEQLEKYKASLEKSALRQSIALRQELELTANSDKALKDSKAYYQKQLDEIGAYIQGVKDDRDGT